MATRSFLGSQRALFGAAVLSGIAVVTPKGTLYAESPSSVEKIKRKPIYDDAPTTIISPSASPSSSSQEQLKPIRPRPTERLAAQIGHARLFLHRYTARSEDWLNATISQGLDLESSFTHTIASLAPDPSTGERVLPGALYVAVAAMAGSILVRRRNILIRGIIPVATGFGAGWVLLPHTMQNLGNLAWRYEKRMPVIAENHMRMRGAAEMGWKEMRERSHKVGKWGEKRIGEARETVEGWVRKGR